MVGDGAGLLLLRRLNPGQFSTLCCSRDTANNPARVNSVGLIRRCQMMQRGERKCGRHRAVLGVSLAILTWYVCPTGPAKAATLDQFYDPGSPPFDFGVSNSSPLPSGQSFTVGIDGELTSVESLMSREDTLFSPAASNFPSTPGQISQSPALISTSFSDALIPIGSGGTGSAYVPIDLSSFDLNVSIGELLTIWLGRSLLTPATWWGASGDGYSQGTALRASRAGSVALDADLGFKTFVEPVPLPAALPLYGTGLGLMGLFGWWQKRKAAARLQA